MKSRAQKQQELEKGKELLATSRSLVFADVSKISAENVRKFRGELRGLGGRLFVIKKRLLGILLKENGIEFNAADSKVSLGTVFSPKAPEEVSTTVYKFFKDQNLEKEKILGGYDIEAKRALGADEVLFLGQLPPREVLLAQFFGQLASPIRSFLYILQEKSKSGSASSKSSG